MRRNCKRLLSSCQVQVTDDSFDDNQLKLLCYVAAFPGYKVKSWRERSSQSAGKHTFNSEEGSWSKNPSDWVESVECALIWDRSESLNTGGGRGGENREGSRDAIRSGDGRCHLADGGAFHNGILVIWDRIRNGSDVVESAIEAVGGHSERRWDQSEAAAGRRSRLRRPLLFRKHPESRPLPLRREGQFQSRYLDLLSKSSPVRISLPAPRDDPSMIHPWSMIHPIHPSNP